MTRIGEHVLPVSTWHPSKSPVAPAFDYIDLSSVDQVSKCVTAPTRISPVDAPSRARQLVQTGDVLVSTVRPNLNGVAMVGPHLDGATASTGFTVLRPGHSLDGRYLFHWVRSPRFIAEMSRRATGASYPAVSDRIVKDAEIPLPSIEEQRRIASVLDQVDAVGVKRREALHRLEELNRSVFLELIGDPLTNPKGWSRAPIKDLGRVVTGNTPSRTDPSNYGPGLEWIKSDNLDAKALTATQARETLSPQGRRLARVVPPGSILVVCIAGSPSSIGRSALVDREVALNQQINAIVPKGADSRFLLAQLRSAPALVRQESTGGMKGLVSKTKFESIQLLAPPLPVQRKLARHLAQVDRLTHCAELSLTCAEALFVAVQGRAFEGRL